jgi:hypothetical protein
VIYRHEGIRCSYLRALVLQHTKTKHEFRHQPFWSFLSYKVIVMELRMFKTFHESAARDSALNIFPSLSCSRHYWCFKQRLGILQWCDLCTCSYLRWAHFCSSEVPCCESCAQLGLSPALAIKMVRHLTSSFDVHRDMVLPTFSKGLFAFHWYGGKICHAWQASLLDAKKSLWRPSVYLTLRVVYASECQQSLSDALYHTRFHSLVLF